MLCHVVPRSRAAWTSVPSASVDSSCMVCAVAREWVTSRGGVFLGMLSVPGVSISRSSVASRDATWVRSVASVVVFSGSDMCKGYLYIPEVSRKSLQGCGGGARSR